MSHYPKWSLALILAIIFYSGSAHAQQSNSSADTAQPTNAELRAKAFALLQSVADQLSNLQSAENRARMGSNIVDSLWDHDEKRARSVLAVVEEDIKAGLQYRESENATDQHTLMVFLRLRADTVERVAKHDAELAIAFFKATELRSDKELPYGVAAAERELELHLSKKVAAKSSELALQLARRVLTQGFSYELLSVGRQLDRKNKEHALIFYEEILRKLRSADFRLNYNARYFVQNLVHGLPPSPEYNSTLSDLMSLFTASASANQCGNNTSDSGEKPEVCQWLASTLQEIQNVKSARSRPPAGRDSNFVSYELSDVFKDGTVDEILALAPKYPDIDAEINRRAIMRAMSSDDIERARKIATDYRGDPERQRAMLAQVDEDQRWASVSDQELADIQNKLNSIPRTRDRIWYLVSVANRAGRTDRKTALKLLNQANEMIDTINPGIEQTQTQVGMAMMYCLEKSGRGLAIMQSLIPKLNELIEAAAKLDGFDTAYLRDGEWNMSANGRLGNLLTELARRSDYFAWCDFDRAVSLAAQFERAEIRLMAQLKLAQSILAGPPNRAARL
jgi:hypothetical protein